MDADAPVYQVARLIGRSKCVLEIGPATGVLTRLLTNDFGCQVTAIEIDEAAARLASPFCREIHVGDIEEADLANLLGSRRFDAITFGDVLEHLRFPLEALKKVRSFLAEGGAVLASVPNISHAAIAYELAHGRFEYRSVGLLDATHIRFFTKQSLVRLFEEAGFAITHLARYRRDPRRTEFAIEPSNDEQRALLNYIMKVNPESTTYQFVVKAVPIGREMPLVAAAAVDAAMARITELEDALEREQKQTRKLESEIRWLEGRWPFSWVRHLASRRK